MTHPPGLRHRAKFPTGKGAQTTRLLLAGVAAVAAAPLGGCAMVGAIAYKFSPPPTVPAKYVPAKEPMVVLVQRADNPSDAQFDADRIARYVTDDLKAHGVGPMIDPAELTAARPRKVGTSVWASAAPATGPATAPAGVPALGAAVGARQVLYVDLVAFEVEGAMATEMARGRADARVRVLDAKTGETRWPADTSQGYVVTIDTPYAQPGEKMDAQTLRNQMSQDVAAHVSQLFYTQSGEGVDSGSPHR